MSVQSDSEEKYQTYTCLLNLRDDLKDLEKKRDIMKDKESEEHYEIVYEIESLEERIADMEDELGLD